MEFEILLNSVVRLPLEKATKLTEEYRKKHEFKNFYQQQKVMDILAHKVNIQRRIRKDVFDNAIFNLAFMVTSRGHDRMAHEAFEDMKKCPMIIWIETIGAMDPKSIMILLERYHNELTKDIIETCIINLPDSMQVNAIMKYKEHLGSPDEMYYNFFYSVSDEARKKLRELFPDVMDDDILLELEDQDEDVVVRRLDEDFDRLMRLSSDDLIEFILLKATNVETLNIFLGKYSEKVKECTIPKFELLFSRYRYVRDGYVRVAFEKRNRWSWNEEDERKLNMFPDSDLFQIFKDKFHEIGITETLELFDHRYDPYSPNEFSVRVITEFLDIADVSVKDSKYVNDQTIEKIMNKFEADCRNKDYDLEQFESLVEKLRNSTGEKLIHDDYIEAIIACGKLLKSRTISDTHPLFLELRSMFSKDVIRKCVHDGTYPEDISLNGIFYRLAKGTLSFDKVYMTKTYRGLIYITKCGNLVDNADYITNFLTDEQVAKLNTKPLLKWKYQLNRTNTEADNLSFVERMGLQLLCYFGHIKAKYLLESNMQGNRMENLFDNLDYHSIKIDENGLPIVNDELLEFLFGKGSSRETNSIMNKMIRGELPDFEKYFTDFCNSYEDVKKDCNNLLSVKRIIKRFDSVDLPIELKPDEDEFKHALGEMNTTNEEILNEAIELCKEARNRDYSTIPKVEGRLGDFTYKILDLDDPLAVAVGYLSHCCFVVRGISYSALKHSMKTRNGRTFVVYRNSKFFTQSWVWRNGDVICFDSVEAGMSMHERNRDEVKLVDVYKKAAEEMLRISSCDEDEIQRVKVVTVGKSDYTFNGLKVFKENVPRPLEEDVYIYDSNIQKVLAGKMPDKPRYGVVGAQYFDERKHAVVITDIVGADIDELDDAIMNINSLRYRIHGYDRIDNLQSLSTIISGDCWYIIVFKDGSVEGGVLTGYKAALDEYQSYSKRYASLNIRHDRPVTKSLLYKGN